MGKQYWRPGNMLYPVPAVMVSAAKDGEKPNIITVAWAGTVCSSPAMVSISVRESRYSYDIIKESKEFVINLVTKDLAYAADLCGVISGRDNDKFAKAGLTAEKMEHVSAPGIKESPVCIECKVVDEIKLGSHSMFLANVEGVAVDESLLDEKGRLELDKANLVAYSHGDYMMLGKKIGSFGYSVRKKPAKKNTTGKNINKNNNKNSNKNTSTKKSNRTKGNRTK